MRTEAAELEAQRLEEVAQEYRAKGYDVVVEPRPDQLPEPLTSYQPDLIAYRGDEKVVVEVKTRASLAEDAQVRDLARAVRAQPGWRFELVFLKPQWSDLLADGAEAWNEADVARSLSEVNTLLDAGHTEAALLLAWAAMEATLRMLAAREKIHLERQDPAYLLKRLATSAAITRQDYDSLWEAMKLRNAVAHGLKPTRLNPAQVRHLTATASRLLCAEQTV